MELYGLDENKNVVPISLEEWAKRFEGQGPNRIISQNFERNRWVSTVFLGVDHSFSRYLRNGDTRPVLFETMIFDADQDMMGDFGQERYCTYAEALEGHWRTVRRLQLRWPWEIWFNQIEKYFNKEKRSRAEFMKRLPELLAKVKANYDRK